MGFKNTAEKYGAVAMTLHWLIALAVFGLMVAGSVMEDIPDKILRFQVFSLHKAFGITVLALMIARLVWKLLNFSLPRPDASHKPWEHKLAAAVQWAFYALLIAMPLSGWLMTSAANSTVSVFGLFTAPAIWAPDPDMRRFFGGIHGLTANLIWLALALHIAGALKHAIIDRDGTLRRMLPVVILITLIPFAARAGDNAPTAWKLDHARSALYFSATQEGGTFTGRFKLFNARISLDPDHPETGSAEIIIDLSSVDTGNGERDATLKEPGWFDLGTTVTATYTADSFERGAGTDDYIAHGSLTLRGLTRKLDLPFRLQIEDKDGVRTARAVGHTGIKRLDFEVGGGRWADTSMVGNEVEIGIDLTATAPEK